MEADIFVDLTKKGRMTAQRIIDLAEVRFTEDGYVGTSIGHIIEDAGITRSNFYRYFKDKNHLLMTILHDPLLELLDATAPEAGEAEGTAAEVEQYISSFVTVYQKYRRLFHAMHEASLTGTMEEKMMWRDSRRRFLYRIKGWCKACPAGQHLDDRELELLAEVLGSLVESMVQRRIGRPEDEPSQELVEQLTRTITIAFLRILEL